MSIRVLTLIVAGGLAVSAQAAILSVDFGLDGSPDSPTQAGFSPFVRPGSSQTGTQTQVYSVSGVTSGAITVDVYLTGATGGCGRDRNVPSVTVSGPSADLYRDLFTRLVEATSDTPATITEAVRLSGLDPNTNYTLDIWSLDRLNNVNGPNSQFTWWDVSSGSAVLIGTITNNNSTGTLAIAGDTDFRLTKTIQSNALGQIRLMHFDSLGTGTINGLQISAVPEPASLGVVAAAGLLALRRRRD